MVRTLPQKMHCKEVNGRANADARYRIAVFSSDVGHYYGGDPDRKTIWGKANNLNFF